MLLHKEGHFYFFSSSYLLCRTPVYFFNWIAGLVVDLWAYFTYEGPYILGLLSVHVAV